MRIAVVHSYYSRRTPSGENVVVDLQVEALRRAGHEVCVVSRNQDDVERSAAYPVLAALRVATNLGSGPSSAIDEFVPDIIHVHNVFPNFGRRWAYRYSSKLVATLHNYRPICAASTLLRDGSPCTLCPDSASAVPALKYRCYKNSRVATLPLALGMRFERDPLLTAASRIITLNDDMRNRYIAVGVPEEKMRTIPNFVEGAESLGLARSDQRDNYWLYAGRLSTDKGVLPLVRSWPEGPHLKVVGSGPLEAVVRGVAGPTVELLGRRNPTEVRHLMSRARGLLFPSTWPEGLPTVYLEALSTGLPVIAWPGSIVAKLVQRDTTGFVTSGDITRDILRADHEFPGLDSHCRSVFQRLYTEAGWLASVERVYQEITDGTTSR